MALQVNECATNTPFSGLLYRTDKWLIHLENRPNGRRNPVANGRYKLLSVTE